jgi:hypothetical protein
MRIAIIGADKSARPSHAVGRKRANEIVFGVRDPAASRYPTFVPTQLKHPSEAAVGAESSSWRRPGMGLRRRSPIWAARRPHRHRLHQSLAMTAMGYGLALGFDSSGGERVAEWAKDAGSSRRSIKLVPRTWPMLDALRPSRRRSSPGDDDGKKPTVMQLVRDLGFEAIDAGPLHNARRLEPPAMVWIHQALRRGRDRDFALALVGIDKLSGAQAPLATDGPALFALR